MERIARHLVQKRNRIILLFFILTVLSAALIPFTKIEYQLSRYLPVDSEILAALDLYQQEFGESSAIRVAVPKIAIPEAASLKERLRQIPGVKRILWLDDVVDVHVPVSAMDTDTLNAYYKSGTALYQVELWGDEYSASAGKAIEEIRKAAGDLAMLDGAAVTSLALRETARKQIAGITLLVIPILFLILLICTTSWFEPVLFIVTIGISAVLNLGTNVFWGEVSFITEMVATILQFAISMDYAIFLLHRFEEQRREGYEPEEAMSRGMAGAISTISASGLTTIAGFVAFLFMRYRLGQDLGIVLAKGIVLSFISVMVLLPALTVKFASLVEKSRHRSFLPSFHTVGKGISKARYFIPIVILVIIPCFLAQNANTFLYGEEAVVVSEGSQEAKDRERMNELFGRNNPMVVMAPRGEMGKEAQVSANLSRIPRVSQVQSAAALLGEGIPVELAPDALLEQFQTEAYSRYVLNLDVPQEGEETKQVIEDIQSVMSDAYGDTYWLVGSSASIDEIRQVMETDFSIVGVISVVAILLIVLLTFRSVSIPILLILIIESAIWLNMSIPYFMGEGLIFIGYLIISAIQLGATIDYGILMSQEYLKHRKIMAKQAAGIAAVETAGPSIFTSALILSVAGFSVYATSSIQGIAQLCLLAGRGAVFSGIFVIFLLPALLILLDPVIMKTTYVHKMNKGANKEVSIHEETK